MKKIILVAGLMILNSVYADVDLSNPSDEEAELIKVCKVEIMYSAAPPKLEDCVNKKLHKEADAPVKQVKKK